MFKQLKSSSIISLFVLFDKFIEPFVEQLFDVLTGVHQIS